MPASPRPAKTPFAPNVTPPRPQPRPLSTGQRSMGWLLVLVPLLAGLSLSISSGLIPGHEPKWHDQLVWQIPHLFQITAGIIINDLPALGICWLLCYLGDKAEGRRLPKLLIWPVVLLLCTLVCCELLWSITGLWVVTCPYTTLLIFGATLYILLLLFLRCMRNPFRSSTALHAIYGGLVVINAFWFLHSLGDGTLFTRHGIFGKTSARAAWDNPLLPASNYSPPYHSWIFESAEVMKAVESHSR